MRLTGGRLGNTGREAEHKFANAGQQDGNGLVLTRAPSAWRAAELDGEQPSSRDFGVISSSDHFLSMLSAVGKFCLHT